MPFWAYRYLLDRTLMTDLLNTMIIKKEIQGQGFYYTSDDYYETQVTRLGYSYKL